MRFVFIELQVRMALLPLCLDFKYIAVFSLIK